MPLILAVRIDNVAKQQALQKVREFLDNGKQNTIFTPNPEMLVDAQKDEYFKTVLNSGTLNICDGKGIQLVSKEKIERIPGADFMLDICRLVEEQGRSVYLLGSGSEDAVRKTAEELKKIFPKLNVVGYDEGPRMHETCNNGTLPTGRQAIEQLNNGLGLKVDNGDKFQITERITQKRPDILFVAFGHNKQEKWIYENLSRLPSVKVAMGVGGAFDYISGKVKRAPCWMRKIGLEWMYRLAMQPARVKRILRATVIFVWLFVISKNSKSKAPNPK